MLKIATISIFALVGLFASELDMVANACKNKMPEACYELSLIYEQGKVVDKNITISANFLEQSCEYGYDKACQKISTYNDNNSSKK